MRVAAMASVSLSVSKQAWVTTSVSMLVPVAPVGQPCLSAGVFAAVMAAAKDVIAPGSGVAVANELCFVLMLVQPVMPSRLNAAV